METIINSLLYHPGKGNQLDKLRIFCDEVETSLTNFSSAKMTLFLADKFNIDLEPRMACHGHNLTLIQNNVGWNKDEIISILKEFFSKHKEIIKEFAESDDYKRIENKWAGYFKVVDNALVFNDAWAQESHRTLVTEVEASIYKVGEYFNIDEKVIFSKVIKPLRNK